jgi:hypothetical protein
MRKIMEEVLKEYEKAAGKFSAFHSAHEGYAVIKEEVDELWDEVKHNPGGTDHAERMQASKDHISLMREEAIQVAAMAMRFVYDVCGG